MITFFKVHKNLYLLIFLDCVVRDKYKKRMLIINKLYATFYDCIRVIKNNSTLELSGIVGEYKQSNDYTCGFILSLYVIVQVCSKSKIMT